MALHGCPGDNVWRHVLSNARTAANHHMRADDAELMHRSHAADDNKIIQRYMPGKRGVIRQNTAVAYRTIMRDVRINHQ